MYKFACILFYFYHGLPLPLQKYDKLQPFTHHSHTAPPAQSPWGQDASWTGVQCHPTQSPPAMWSSSRTRKPHRDSPDTGTAGSTHRRAIQSSFWKTLKEGQGWMSVILIKCTLGTHMHSKIAGTLWIYTVSWKSVCPLPDFLDWIFVRMNGFMSLDKM